MKTTKATRNAKAARREHRRATRGARGQAPTLDVLGGYMEPELMAQILAAVERFDPGAPWPEVAPTVLPVLRRVHHPYPPEATPMHLFVPPGVWTGFGLDFGPAFTHVTAGLVSGWGIDQATLLGTALENLRRLTVVEPPQVEAIHPDGVETIAIQGQGWGSALVLLPEVLGPILGEAPRLLLAPVRNTLLALPADVDDDLMIRLWEAVAEGSHDELDVGPLLWTGSAVVVDDSGATGLPN